MDYHGPHIWQDCHVGNNDNKTPWCLIVIVASCHVTAGHAAGSVTMLPARSRVHALCCCCDLLQADPSSAGKPAAVPCGAGGGNAVPSVVPAAGEELSGEVRAAVRGVQTEWT
jgi:hypothetical protein